MVDDSRHRDNFISAHHEGPRLAVRPGDLGVDEHVLDLLPPAGEPVARPPASYLKACELGFDLPLAPADWSLERNRAGLEPEPVVFADRLEPAAEVEPLRAGRGIEQLRQGGRELTPLLERAEQVRVRGRMDLPEQRQDLLAD